MYRFNRCSSRCTFSSSGMSSTRISRISLKYDEPTGTGKTTAHTDTYHGRLNGGTDVLAVHDGLPRGVPAADNEAGWREALAKLAALVEAG